MKVLNLKDTSPFQKLFLLFLKEFEGEIEISLSNLEGLFGKTRSYIYRQSNDLEKKGYVKIIRENSSANGFVSNKYFLLVEV